MTRRAAFGDFAQLTRRHLAVPARPPGSAKLNPDVVALQIQDYFHGLHRILRTMNRYAADIGEPSQLSEGPQTRTADPWAHALVQARKRLQDAHLRNPLLLSARDTTPQGERPGPIARRLAAAAEAMSAGRDLLHTHFAAGPGGTRQPLTEWSAVIASEPAGRALLAEIGGWARQIVTCTTELTTTRTMDNATAIADQRRFIAMHHHLTAAAAVIQTAQERAPLPDQDRRQLHAIQVNMVLPARQPARAESVAGLCQGIIDSAERTRHAFATAVPQAAWSPELAAESFCETAAAAAAISHHSQLIQQALAERARNLGADALSRSLRSSAHSVGQAGQGWLEAARAWHEIRTDATCGSSSVTAEVNDLVLWTGRLAHASPGWRPGRKTAAKPRAPEALAPGLDDISVVADAIDRASATIVAIAAADYARIRTAAQSGRLLAPLQGTRFVSDPVLLTRASRYRATTLLETYRDAGAVSANAAASVAEAAAEIRARGLRTSTPRQPRPRWKPGQIAGPHASRQLDPASPAGLAEANAGSDMPGPVERVLVELGVTNPELINRGIVIDRAASKLIDEAAQETAALRWNTAVTSNKTTTAAGKIVDHVLARDGRQPAIRITAPSVGSRDLQPKEEAEALQAEP